MFFNEEGLLNLDELVTKSHTFQKIMNDEFVSDEELMEQTQMVIQLYHQLEESFSAEQLEQIANVMVQTGVLYSISQYKELQDLNR